MKPSELAEEYAKKNWPNKRSANINEMETSTLKMVARMSFMDGFEKAISLCLDEVAMFSWDKPHNGFSEYGKGAQEVVDQITNNIKSLKDLEG